LTSTRRLFIDFGSSAAGARDTPRPAAFIRSHPRSGSPSPQLIILDEPANHLDLDPIARVEQALAGYDDALPVVSHDEDFLAAVGARRTIAL
jgi:hypothetical protein